MPQKLPNEAQIFINASPIDRETGRVQLAPFGDFLNVDNRGNRVIQRFEKPDAENMVNEFNRLANLPTRLLGLPFYIGHPDHARFNDVYKDSRAYGRVKSLEAGDDGLYGNVRFGGPGKQLLDDEAFSGHSVNWLCEAAGKDRGLPVFRPVALKSVGFTNSPVIPVIPASLANEEIAALGNELPAPSSGGPDPEEPNNKESKNDEMIIPPKLKLIAGFKADEDVTMDQVIAALEKAKPQPVQPKPMANEKKVELMIGDQKVTVTLANEDGGELQKAITTFADAQKTALANERKSHATTIVDALVKAGKIVTADRDAKIVELANAEDPEAKAKEFANAKPVIKVKPKTGDLAGKHTVVVRDQATRQARFQTLLNERREKFPNEDYEKCFTAVADSEEGQSLFQQMQRPESNENV